MKGMMGLIYHRMDLHGITRLDSAIVSLAARLKPDLVVVDATKILATNGPEGPGQEAGQGIMAISRIIARRLPAR